MSIKYYNNLICTLKRELSKDRVMVIITGISGTGKSTIMKELKEEVVGNNVFLSVDDFKVREYEKYGFRNETEKLKLRSKALESFKESVVKTAKEGYNIIVEYPFKVEWQPFFDYIRSFYGYRLVVVNCNSKDFDDVWRNKVNRDLNPNERHRSLVSDMYLGEDNWLPSNECSKSSKDRHYALYLSNYYNSIRGDVVYQESGLQEKIKEVCLC